MGNRIAELIGVDESVKKGTDFPFLKRMRWFRRKYLIFPTLERLNQIATKLDEQYRVDNPYLAKTLGDFSKVEQTANTALAGAEALPTLLRKSALSSTVPSQIASMQAARQLAGRGGLAFGGGGASIAAQAGVGAAANYGDALAGALAQAPMAQAAIAGQVGQLFNQRDSLRMTEQQNLAKLFEGVLERKATPDRMRYNLWANLASVFETGASQRATARIGKSGFFNKLAQFGKFLEGVGSFARGVRPG